jgi:hypothetical protein
MNKDFLRSKIIAYTLDILIKFNKLIIKFNKLIMVLILIFTVLPFIWATFGITGVIVTILSLVLPVVY